MSQGDKIKIVSNSGSSTSVMSPLVKPGLVSSEGVQGGPESSTFLTSLTWQERQRLHPLKAVPRGFKPQQEESRDPRAHKKSGHSDGMWRGLSSPFLHWVVVRIVCTY